MVKKTFGNKIFNTLMAIATIVVSLAVAEALRTGVIALPFIGPAPILGWAVYVVVIWGFVQGLMEK